MSLSCTRTALATLRVAACLAVLAPGPASATTIQVEPSGTYNMNYWPMSFEEMHWQQGYSSAFFGPDPFEIQSFGFRALNSSSVSYADISIVMSTTSAMPNSLSTSFAANHGPDATAVYAGPIALTSSVGTFLTIVLETPFLYDPSAGNLMIEITHGGSLTPGNIWLDAYNPTPVGLDRVAIDDSDATTGIRWGFGELVTQFEVTAVPEPSTGLLVSLGLLGMGVSRART